MPSPLGHFAAGAIVAALPTKRSPRPTLARLTVAGIAGALADLDFLPVVTGLISRSAGHRTFSHSLTAVVAVLLVCFALNLFLRRRGSKIKIPTLLVTACYGLHLLLDLVGGDVYPPYGIMLLWPFSDRYFTAGLHLFPALVTPDGRTIPFAAAVEAVTQEMIVIGLLGAALLIPAHLIRMRRDYARKKLSFTDLKVRLGGEKMDLCHYCGTCIAICPHRALTPGKNEKPVYDPAKCKSCSLCYTYCSGRAVDFAGIERRFFKGATPDPILGPYLKTYIGHSNIRAIRAGGSSGGMVSGVLVYALKAGLIDGAIVAGSRADKPWLPETKLVKDPDEVSKYAQSKYCYIPTNAFLRTLWDELGERSGRYAIVALPCQIHAIRQMQRDNIKYAKNIKYIFGLICGHNMTIEATEFVRRKLGVAYEDIAHLRYRDLKWPGGITFYLKNGGKRGLHLFHYHYLNAMFLPTRCRTSCDDFFAEHADIAFGDSWLKHLYSTSGENLGWSSLITRTKVGDELLTACREAGEINLIEVDKKDVIGSFPHNIKYKKRGGYYRFKMARHKPEYGDRPRRPENIGPAEIAYHIIYNLIYIGGATKLFKTLVYWTPFEALMFAIQKFKLLMGYPPNARDSVFRKGEKTVYLED